MAQLSVSEFDFCFLRHRPMLEAYARMRVSREDAEDLVSGCFLQARHSLNAYHPERELVPWLKGILENLLRLHFRRVRIRREDLYGNDDCPLEGQEQAGSEAVRNALLRQRMMQRMAAVDLTARQYECLMRILDGETQQQIANSLGITQRMVSYHIHAAQEHLRAFFTSEQGGKDIDAVEFFYECAHHPIYHKPHSFDNQSNSIDREQHRYACLNEARKEDRETRRQGDKETRRRIEDKSRRKNILAVNPVNPERSC